MKQENLVFLVLFLVHQLLKMLLNRFLSKTPICKTTESTCVQGFPTPVVQGSMSPNEQAITLLAGFASGNIKMEGVSIKHVPTIPKGSITQTLNEVWGTPKQKKDTSGSAICTKKARVAQKEPEKTIARQLAEKEPHTKIPDSEIRLENIVPGSPTFVPYKCIKSKGKGKGVKLIQFLLLILIQKWLS